VLFFTGLVLFIPGIAILAEDSWTRLIHRIAVVVFVLAPVIYIPMNFKATLRGVKDAFTWGADDIGWLLAAPRYYMLSDEEAMPPQGHMNTGQKMWWFIVIVFGAIFLVTGAIMWFGKQSAPHALLQWMVFVHDVAFIVTGAMLFVHIYLSVAHPLMKGAFNSMAKGKVSAEYAKSHHGKWYEEITGGKKAD
jgi:formate dehydrogenase subunit gamma